MARVVRWAGVVAAVVAGLVVAAWLALRWDSHSGPRLAIESSIVAPDRPDEPPVLVMLNPGEDVQTAVPNGWSDLIVKSVTFLDGGDVDTLPAFAKVTATRFRTVVVADVGHDPGSSRYRLRRVGAGLALAIKGIDTTISSETVKEQGVELGTIDGLVLSRAERALGRSRLVATTSTFALYETFVEIADARGVHHAMNLYYAILVDPATGAVRTACWSMAESAGDRTAPETFHLLPPRLTFHCGIHIAARRVVGNFAASWGFAMTSLPPGEAIAMPPKLKAMLEAGINKEQAAAIEMALREAIGPRG